MKIITVTGMTAQLSTVVMSLACSEHVFKFCAVEEENMMPSFCNIASV